MPSLFLQRLVEELPRGFRIMRQAAGETGRSVAVIGVDISDQGFRRTEPGLERCCREAGNKEEDRSEELGHDGIREVSHSLLSRPWRKLSLMKRSEATMRELFEEVLGQSPLDPEEAVRQSTRGPQRKRFYTTAAVASTPEGFAITLDDKPVRTPSRRSLVAPTAEIAEVMAAEWAAQKDIIDPMTMPLTRLANSVIDAVADRVDAVADGGRIYEYSESDLLIYRAGYPDALVDGRPGIGIRCCLAADTLCAHFILAEGIVHVRQPDQAIAAARAALPAKPWSIAALHVLTTLTGSALLALALLRGVLDEDQVWSAAHVDEDWNSEQWALTGRSPPVAPRV